jgi:hypothetical protein
MKFAKVAGREQINTGENVDMLSVLADDMVPWMESLAKTRGGNIDYIDVSVATFNDVMKNYPDRTYIDFISIDVEGSELNVLQSIDFDKYEFGMLAIENNFTDDRLENFMQSKGYKIFMDAAYDMIFVQN